MNGLITVAAAISGALGLLVSQSTASTALLSLCIALAGVSIVRFFVSLIEHDPWRALRREIRAGRDRERR